MNPIGPTGTPNHQIKHNIRAERSDYRWRQWDCNLILVNVTLEETNSICNRKAINQEQIGNYDM